MKLIRSIAIVLLSVSTILSFNSCQELETESSNVVLSSEDPFQAVGSDAVSATFEIKSNADWSVICNAEWIADYTRSGSGDGIVTVTFSENTSEELERSAAFSVVAGGGKSISLTLVQARSGADLGDVELSAQTLALTVTADDTSAEFPIQSNSIWGVYTEDDWFNDYTTMGEGDGSLVISFDAYKNRKRDRTATFIVSARDMTITLTLTQTKTDRIEVIDTDLEKFAQAEADPDMFYRLIGQITSIEDNVNGAITITDATKTSVKVTGLLDANKGQAGNFAQFNAKVGDGIYLVAARGGSASEVETALSEAYVESVKHLVATDMAAYIALADTDASWYELSGNISAISNLEQGAITLKNPVGEETLTINSVLTGVNGSANSFGTLNAAVDDKITLIIPGKAGATVEKAFYVSHKPGKYPLGKLAEWTFTKSGAIAVESYATWTRNCTTSEFSNFADTDKSEVKDITKVGDTGYFIWSDDKKSKFVFTQVDKAGFGIWSSLQMYSTGQPGFSNVWVGDAFEMQVATVYDVPAGTKIEVKFSPRLPKATMGCLMLEYFVNGGWKPAVDDEHPVKTINCSGVDYQYNILKTGNNDATKVVVVFETEAEIPMNQLKIRLRFAAPYTCAGNVIDKPSGSARFRGEDSKYDWSHPVITVVE